MAVDVAKSIGRGAEVLLGRQPKLVLGRLPVNLRESVHTRPATHSAP